MNKNNNIPADTYKLQKLSSKTLKIEIKVKNDAILLNITIKNKDQYSIIYENFAKIK